MDFKTLDISPQKYFRKTIRNFLESFRVSWCLEREIIVVLGLMETSRNPEIIEMKVFGLSHNGIEKLLIQNEAE